MRLPWVNNLFSFIAKTLFLWFLIAFWGSCTDQKGIDNTYTVAFYNTENLFDTIDHPDFADDEFTPEGKKHWDSHRYRKKLNDIANVLSSINPLDCPELIGLCEIENRSVLEDLVKSELLASWNYGIIQEESPDFRGIDVALLYRQDKFSEVKHKVLPVVFPDEPEYKTRDILYVSGKMDHEIVHVFVNHWPSRIGGKDKSEPNRVQVASILRNEVNRIFSSDKNARIIIMGDMNDEPVDKSIYETLGAKSINDRSPLVNLMIDDDREGLGTYNFRGNWNMLDNLIVSGEILNGQTFKVEGMKGFIYSNDSMVYITKDGVRVPDRTYVGNRYVAGTSDHFPVYFKFFLN